MSRRRLVAGNWKMNASVSESTALVNGIAAGLSEVAEGTDIAVFPPAPYLPLVQQLCGQTPIRWGGQNLSDQSSGAYTGEVSASMLSDFGCQLVLVGHSERRSLFGDTDTWVADKVAAALAAGLVAVLCVGESLEERQSEQTEAVVERQLRTVIERVGIAAFANIIVAYEPVWAIGTGQTATPEQAQAVHAFIRSKLAELDATMAGRVQILYGGSVKGTNAAQLFAQPDIDGGLIGGASLTSEDFLAICRAQ